MKVCTKCNTAKELTEFRPQKRYSQGVYCWCRDCERIYGNKRYAKNPELGKARQLRLQAKRRVILNELKLQPCKDCGNVYHPVAMDFDHVRGEKFRNLSVMMSYSEEKFLEEVAKCEVVCSNCHRLRTFKREQLC